MNTTNETKTARRTKAENFEAWLMKAGVAFQKTVKRDDLCRLWSTEIYVPCEDGRGFVQVFFSLRDGGSGRRRSERFQGNRYVGGTISKMKRLSNIVSAYHAATIGNGIF
jgi:hypothetical protein